MTGVDAVRRRLLGRLPPPRHGLAVHAVADPYAVRVVVDSSTLDVDAVGQDALDRARDVRVLFAHQSVGADLLHGLEALAAADPVRYRLPRPVLSSVRLGRNGDPLAKISQFERLVVHDGYGSRVDVAMMKLCYADMLVVRPQRVWDAYRSTVRRLQSRFPNVTFVWTTVPLTAGRNRDQRLVNDAVRTYVSAAGGVLLDLASLESVAPTGAPTAGRDGAPRLDPAYDVGDGGHLNEAGRLRLAAGWWQLLAALDRRVAA